jgi:hypothetical protein
MNIKRFIFDENGNEVIQVSTSDVTGYIAASIPIEPLQVWHRYFAAQLRRASRFNLRLRLGKRCRLIARRMCKQRVRPKKRFRGRVRYWSMARDLAALVWPITLHPKENGMESKNLFSL